MELRGFSQEEISQNNQLLIKENDQEPLKHHGTKPRIELSGTSSDSGFEEESEVDRFQRQTHTHASTRLRSSIEPKSGIEDGSTSAAMNENVMNDEEREILKNALDSMNIHGAPIPLYFDYETFDVVTNPATNEEFDVNYYGSRFKDSLEMHKAFANFNSESYKFKFPPNMNVIEAMQLGQRRKREDPRPFIGMNPIVMEQKGFINSSIFKQPSLIFDSKFECGNLDMAIQVKDQEYDLYMRVDSNTRGHHQWFYFAVYNNSLKGKVKFNIVNFTKNASLYHQGMKINVFSQKDFELRKSKDELIMNEGWTKGGENINYKLSKLSQVPFNFRSNASNTQQQQQLYQQYLRSKKYFQLTFEYEFKNENDKVYFAYSVPYSFSKLYNFLKHVSSNHQLQYADTSTHFIKESYLCKSLSGLDVPMMTVTSRVNKQNYDEIDPEEFSSSDQIPLNKYKKYMIVCSRVHPGETNASYIMQGFINFITSPTNIEAIELRKRIIFKIVPMTNPDGVIVGNYRTSLSGNDLNRQFISPNIKLHPTVCAIKAMISEIIQNAKEPDPIASFIDIHGHSRKKSIFIYGPYFPLHNERYLKMRVLPKLLSEKTDMFRFYSCKFRIQKSKLKAARVVLWKEFNIMNCFTLEASFHGYIDKERQTVELTTEMFENMGQILGSGFHEYQILIEEDEKQRLLLKQQLKNKKKKIKAKDIVKAYSQQQEQQILGIKKGKGQNETGCANSANPNIDYLFSSEPDEKGEFSDKCGPGSLPASVHHGNFSGSELPPKDTSAFKHVRKRKESNFNSKRETSLIADDNDERVIIEAKRSSAENTPRGGHNLKHPVDRTMLKSLEPVSANFQIEDPNANNGRDGYKKPFRIKKNKQKTNATSTGRPHQSQNQKRTLKEIYKLLKRDIKSIAVTSDNQKQAVNEQQQNRNFDEFSSNSSDDDDDGEKVEEDGEKSMCYDDLSPSELEELQGDIIKVIENFDEIYNKKKQKKTKKNKPKKKQQDKGQALQGSGIEGTLQQFQMQKIKNPFNQDDLLRIQASIQSKNANMESLKRDSVYTKPLSKSNNVTQLQNPSSTTFNFSSNLISNNANQKLQGKQQNRRNNDQYVQQQQNTNYHRFVLNQANNNVQRSTHLGPLYGEKFFNQISNNSANNMQNLSVSGIMYKAQQQQQQQQKTSLHLSQQNPVIFKSRPKQLGNFVSYTNEASRFNNSQIDLQQSQYDQNSLGIQNNIRNLLKMKDVNTTSSNPSTNQQYMHQRNSLNPSAQQILLQSKSQDRCKPGIDSQLGEQIIIGKSFEDYKNGKGSKSNNVRNNQFNADMIIQNQSPLEQYQQNLEVNSDNGAINSNESIYRHHHHQFNGDPQNSSKSSRLIFLDKDSSQLIEKKKFIKTPSSRRPDYSGTITVATTSQDEIGSAKNATNHREGSASTRPFQLNQRGEIIRQQARKEGEQIKFSGANTNFNCTSRDQSNNFKNQSDNDKKTHIFSYKANYNYNDNKQIQNNVSVSNNQTLIIQNIIIGGGGTTVPGMPEPFRKYNKDQVLSPNSDLNRSIERDITFRDQQEKVMKKKKKGKKGSNDPSRRGNYRDIEMLQSAIIPNQPSHSLPPHSNLFISQERKDYEQARRNFAGIKFQQNMFSQQEIHGHPYTEEQNVFKKKNSQVYGSDNGDMPLIIEEPRGALNNIVNTSKIAQMATSHMKKHSAEYNPLINVKNNERINTMVYRELLLSNQTKNNKGLKESNNNAADNIKKNVIKGSLTRELEAQYKDYYKKKQKGPQSDKKQ